MAQTEAHYRAFFDVLGEGLIVWGADGRVVSCNSRAAEIMGLPLERLRRLRREELMDLAESEMQPIGSDGSPYPRDATPALLAQRSGAVAGQVMGILRPDGRRVWLEVDVRSLTDEAHGELLIVSFRDITERKEAQDRTQLQANILEAIAQAVIVMEADGTIVYWNRAATELYGWRGDDALGQPVSEFLPADHTPDDISALLRTLRAGKVWSGDVEVQRRDGTMVSAFIVDTPVLGDDGRLSRIISVSTDVTERKRADDQMRALSAIVESSSDAIIRFGIDGMIESWNGGAQTLYGYSAEEVIGRHGSMLAPDDRAAEYEGVLAKVLWGQSVENLLTLAARRDGSAVHVAVTASPVYNADRTVVGMSVVAGNVDELVAARDALAESEERFRSLVQRSADVAFVVRRGVIQYASPAVERFGYTPDEVVGTSVWEYVHPDDVAQGHDRLMMALLMGQTVSLEGRIRTADGEWRWAEVVVTDMCDVAAIGGIVANVRDITDRRRAEQERGEAEERYTQGFERSSFGLAILDLRRTLTSVNPTLAEMLGYPVERLLGRTPIEFFHPSETDAARDGLERVLHPDAPAFYKREHRMIRADGSVVFVLIDTTVVHDCDDAPSYYFMQIHDITDRKRAEGALEHQALHDDLTRLPNRLLLVDRLSQSLARAKRTDTRVAVLFLDIDRFKLVNDGLGHGVGDQLLIEVAQRLASALRPSDTIARFGGDEFVVVCEDIRNEKQAVEFAERLSELLSAPISVNGRELYTSASIGIAIGGRESSADQLLRDADAAMYRAKDLGRARIELFSRELRQRVAERLDLETSLRHAIDRDELRLLFQPIVRLADGHVVGAEALLRWHRAGYGNVSPAEFIPVAEESGLIIPIGAWALEHALEELQDLAGNRADDSPWPLVAVNLSALQLRLPASTDMIRDTILNSGVDPSMLALEITESTLMEDVDRSARAMSALRDLGVRFAVDDFGTGYSSLAYLKRLPIDSLKIDRSFIGGLPSEPNDVSITEAIITLGRTLGLTIVAEGVETVEQWIALDELGCTVGQGFLWSQPVPASEFAPLLYAGYDELRAAAP